MDLLRRVHEIIAAQQVGRPVLTVEEFFDGNTEEGGSIGCYNLWRALSRDATMPRDNPARLIEAMIRRAACLENPRPKGGILPESSASARSTIHLHAEPKGAAKFRVFGMIPK